MKSTFFILFLVFLNCRSLAQEVKTLSGYFIKYNCVNNLEIDVVSTKEVLIQLNDTTLDNVIKTFHQIILNPDSLLFLIENGKAIEVDIDPPNSGKLKEFGFKLSDVWDAKTELDKYCKVELPYIQYKNYNLKDTFYPRYFSVELSVVELKLKVVEFDVIPRQYCCSEYYSNGFHVLEKVKINNSIVKRNVMVKFLGHP